MKLIPIKDWPAGWYHVQASETGTESWMYMSPQGQLIRTEEKLKKVVKSLNLNVDVAELQTPSTEIKTTKRSAIGSVKAEKTPQTRSKVASSDSVKAKKTPKSSVNRRASTDSVKSKNTPESPAKVASTDRNKSEDNPNTVAKKEACTDKKPLKTSAKRRAPTDSVKADTNPNAAAKKVASTDIFEPRKTPKSPAKRVSTDSVKAEKTPKGPAKRVSTDSVKAEKTPQSPAKRVSTDSVKAEKTPKSPAKRVSTDSVKAEKTPQSPAKRVSTDSVKAVKTLKTKVKRKTDVTTRRTPTLKIKIHNFKRKPEQEPPAVLNHDSNILELKKFKIEVPDIVTEVSAGKFPQLNINLQARRDMSVAVSQSEIKVKSEPNEAGDTVERTEEPQIPEVPPIAYNVAVTSDQHDSTFSSSLGALVIDEEALFEPDYEEMDASFDEQPPPETYDDSVTNISSKREHDDTTANVSPGEEEFTAESEGIVPINICPEAPPVAECQAEASDCTGTVSNEEVVSSLNSEFIATDTTPPVQGPCQDERVSPSAEGFLCGGDVQPTSPGFIDNQSKELDPAHSDYVRYTDDGLGEVFHYGVEPAEEEETGVRIKVEKDASTPSLLVKVEKDVGIPSLTMGNHETSNISELASTAASPRKLSQNSPDLYVNMMPSPGSNVFTRIRPSRFPVSFGLQNQTKTQHNNNPLHTTMDVNSVMTVKQSNNKTTQDIQLCVQGKRYRRAVALFKRCEEGQQREIIPILAQIDDEQILEIVENIFIADDPKTYVGMIGMARVLYCAKHGNYTGALQILEKLVERGIDPLDVKLPRTLKISLVHFVAESCLEGKSVSLMRTILMDHKWSSDCSSTPLKKQQALMRLTCIKHALFVLARQYEGIDDPEPEVGDLCVDLFKQVLETEDSDGKLLEGDYRTIIDFDKCLYYVLELLLDSLKVTESVKLFEQVVLIRTPVKTNCKVLRQLALQLFNNTSCSSQEKERVLEKIIGICFKKNLYPRPKRKDRTVEIEVWSCMDSGDIHLLIFQSLKILSKTDETSQCDVKLLLKRASTDIEKVFRLSEDASHFVAALSRVENVFRDRLQPLEYVMENGTLLLTKSSLGEFAKKHFPKVVTLTRGGYRNNPSITVQRGTEDIRKVKRRAEVPVYMNNQFKRPRQQGPTMVRPHQGQPWRQQQAWRPPRFQPRVNRYSPRHNGYN